MLLPQEVVDPPTPAGDDEAAPVPSGDEPVDAPSAAPDAASELADARTTIGALQTKVLEVTAARDALLESLGSVQTTMASLQGQVSHLEDENAELRDYKTAALDKLTAAEASEATISNLRSSLEEARRTLMRLQGGEKDLRVASGSAGTHLLAPAAAESPSKQRDKRMSLGVGAVGRGGDKSHRRVSSISDSGVFGGLPEPLNPPTLTKGGLRELRLSQAPAAPAPPPAAAGITSLFGGWGAGSAVADVKEAAKRASLSGGGEQTSQQQQVDLSHSSDDDVSPEEARRQTLERLQARASPTPSAETVPMVDPSELSSLQSEVQALRRELAASRLAREASEAACRALREFVAKPQAERERELEGVSLPPLPSDMDGVDSDDASEPAHEDKPSVLTGWFKRKPSNPAGPSASSQAAVPAPPAGDASNVSVAGSVFASVTDGASSSAAVQPPPLPHSTSFISSWTRKVSQADAASPPTQPLPSPNRPRSESASSSADAQSAPPPLPAKPSRFSFFTLGASKGGANPSTPPAVGSPGQEHAPSAPSTLAPTIHEEAPQDEPATAAGDEPSSALENQEAFEQQHERAPSPYAESIRAGDSIFTSSPTPSAPGSPSIAQEAAADEPAGEVVHDDAAAPEAAQDADAPGDDDDAPAAVDGDDDGGAPGQSTPRLA